MNETLTLNKVKSLNIYILRRGVKMMHNLGVENHIRKPYRQRYRHAYRKRYGLQGGHL